jgi:hypothetical protein
MGTALQCGLQPVTANVRIAMNDRPKEAEKIRQEQRLRAALRENLKRRKAQAKARAADEAHRRASHDSAGIADHKEKS